MKYPIEQYNELVKGLKKLAVFIDIKTINPHALHFVIFQQGSEGQKHNHLLVKGLEISKAHKLENTEGWVKLININPDFMLYPEGCNDNHIETAMKKALKELNQL